MASRTPLPAERERTGAAAGHQAQGHLRRADALDERARRVVDGWSEDLAQERAAAAEYPAGPLSAVVSCPDCGAPATVAFEPRALSVSFTCPAGTGHGSFRLGNDDQEPIAVWRSEGREYVALGLVAPVLAGGDEAWDRVYGTRADDYRATARALARSMRRTRSPCSWRRTYGAVTAAAG